MKRIQERSAAALVMAGVVVLGLLLYVFLLARNGQSWASYAANQHIYRGGVLKSGTVTDRNGTVLAECDENGWRYADDEALRRASLHAVGDHRGYIGSGALRLFAGELSGYSFVNGTPEGGNTVALSLDSELQRTAYTALGGRNGAVVLMNYETGEILCMVSLPTYDPNGEADTSLDGVFINRATGAGFTPGSIFKLVTLAAAIDCIPDLRERTFVCEHTVEYGPDTVTCSGWHGEQTIEMALANSCNVAFAQLATELGGDTLARYAKKLGVSGALTLDGATLGSGRFDTAEKGTSLEAWSGIGQYNDLVTPYAMMRLCAGIAAGGTVREPTLLLGGGSERTSLLAPACAELIGECMHYAVTQHYGEWNFPGLDLCAKTGTAELDDGSRNGWFVGYLRSGAPLAFAVVLERGGDGITYAAPVANTVLQKAVEIYGQ